MDAIKQRFEKTGKCDMQLLQDHFWTVPTVIGLKLNSPFTSTISKGYQSSPSILLNRLTFHFEIEKIERAAGERIVQLLGSVVPSNAGQVFAKHQRNDQ